jgi:hypothetical protein
MPANAPIPAVPLRKATLSLDKLKIGQEVMFAESCTLPQLRANKAMIVGIRRYRFGRDEMQSFQLSTGSHDRFWLAVAEDEEGHYLALSRELDPAQQEQWFGRDALSFFTEESTAKTIRCKADRLIEGAWAAERYIKSVDWIEGRLLGEGRLEQPFHYNLLVNETGEKALEIEHFDGSGKNHICVTVYRPVDDILTISESNSTPKPAPAPAATPEPERHSSGAIFRQPPLKAEPVLESPKETLEEPPLFLAPGESKPGTAGNLRQRPDFRRISQEAAEEIHITAPTVEALQEEPQATPSAPLPSFLTDRRETAYLSLDEVIPPEPERVRCGILAAKALIDVALERKVRVRDVLRELLGLDSALSEEVIFELPLSEKDFRTLAQRYKLRADHREEIRARLQEELRKKLLS